MESGGERGIRTLGTVSPYTRFPGEHLKPLSHLSTSNCQNPFGIDSNRPMAILTLKGYAAKAAPLPIASAIGRTLGTVSPYTRFDSRHPWRSPCGRTRYARASKTAILPYCPGEHVDSGHPAPRPSGACALLRRPKSLPAILLTTQPSLRILLLTPS
jgi:hypothetical protein